MSETSPLPAKPSLEQLQKRTEDRVQPTESLNSNFAVMAAYQAATGTPPPSAQFTAVVASIRTGTQTVTGLFNSLKGPSYPATALYQNLLNRTPSAGEISSTNQAGLASWFRMLIGAAASVTPVGSPNNEFQNTGTYRSAPITATPYTCKCCITQF